MSSPALRCAALACLLGLLAPPAQAAPIDLKERTVSSSKQFTIFCTDVALRSRIASFAEELKAQWLHLIGESDHWKNPVLVTLQRAEAENPQTPPVSLSLIQYDGGFKVQIDVRIGADPAQVNLQKHILRALYLEYAYRTHPEAVKEGTAFIEAPWWLVEGSVGVFRNREQAVESDLFKRMVDLNRVPSLPQFLAERPDETAGSTVLEMQRGCAMCLVQLLLEQDSGRANLASYIRHLPEGAKDPLAALQRDFPALAEAGGAQKWWTLNLARLAANDRYKGLTPEETDAQLAALLQFEIPGNKGGDKKMFGIADFEEYLKLTASRPLLTANQAAVLTLSAQANALYRGIVAEYEQIFGLLARGKTHGLKDRLTRLGSIRESLLRRRSEIADYLNWFEATQMHANEHAFDGYIKAANALSTAPSRNDPITRYLDEIAQEL